ncbi:hypothetical protein BHM03_00045379 [Ensete ventricosum]|nr:hypothetical protein BHM03_00045379 [Ensete ventricosum]
MAVGFSASSLGDRSPWHYHCCHCRGSHYPQPLVTLRRRQRVLPQEMRHSHSQPLKQSNRCFVSSIAKIVLAILLRATAHRLPPLPHRLRTRSYSLRLLWTNPPPSSWLLAVVHPGPHLYSLAGSTTALLLLRSALAMRPSHALNRVALPQRLQPLRPQPLSIATSVETSWS